MEAPFVQGRIEAACVGKLCHPENLTESGEILAALLLPYTDALIRHLYKYEVPIEGEFQFALMLVPKDK